MTDEPQARTLSAILRGMIRRAMGKTILYPLYGLLSGLLALLPLKLLYGSMTQSMILLYAVFYVIILESLNLFSFLEDFRKATNHTAATLLLIVKVAAVYLLFLRLALFGETQILYHILVSVPLIGWSAQMYSREKNRIVLFIIAMTAVLILFGQFRPENMLASSVPLNISDFELLRGLKLTLLPLSLTFMVCISGKAAFADTAALIGFLVVADRLCYAV